ncbi:MAG: hypothetical protein OHK0031_13400 [Anaerolineales bacterium]
MEILGVGLPELLFVVILALVLLGPKDMAETGRLLGRWLNRFVKSDGYKVFTQTTKELTGLPTRLMREANLEEAKENLEAYQQDVSQKLSGSIKPPRKQYMDEKELLIATPETPSAPPAADAAPAQTPPAEEPPLP